MNKIDHIVVGIFIVNLWKERRYIFLLNRKKDTVGYPFNFGQFFAKSDPSGYNSLMLLGL